MVYVLFVNVINKEFQFFIMFIKKSQNFDTGNRKIQRKKSLGPSVQSVIISIL